MTTATEIVTTTPETLTERVARRLRDGARFFDACRAEGIAAPATWYCELERAEALEIETAGREGLDHVLELRDVAGAKGATKGPA